MKESSINIAGLIKCLLVQLRIQISVYHGHNLKSKQIKGLIIEPDVLNLLEKKLGNSV